MPEILKRVCRNSGKNNGLHHKENNNYFIDNNLSTTNCYFRIRIVSYLKDKRRPWKEFDFTGTPDLYGVLVLEALL